MYRILVLIILFGCARDTEDLLGTQQWRTYNIKKGNHSSGFRVNTFSRTDLKFRAIFTETCIYSLEANQDDINKLYGFSDCGDSHTDNSARFGWRWMNNTIEIFAFVHNDGKMAYRYVGSTPVNVENDYEIRIIEGAYIFLFNGSETIMPRSCITINFNRYYLYPYFGGDEVAPHKMIIKIKEI